MIKALRKDERNLLYSIPDHHRLVAIPDLDDPFTIITPEDLYLPFILGGTSEPLPPSLPARTVNWDIGPRSGNVFNVDAAPYNGDLQAAINAATTPGDNIKLTHGTTYVTPSTGLTFPALVTSDTTPRVYATPKVTVAVTTMPTIAVSAAVTHTPVQPGEPSAVLIYSDGALPSWDVDQLILNSDSAQLATIKANPVNVGEQNAVINAQKTSYRAFHGVIIQGKNWPYGFYEALVLLGNPNGYTQQNWNVASPVTVDLSAGSGFLGSFFAPVGVPTVTTSSGSPYTPGVNYSYTFPSPGKVTLTNINITGTPTIWRIDPGFSAEHTHHFWFQRCIFDGAADFPSASILQSYNRAISPMGRYLGTRGCRFKNIWPYQENQYMFSEFTGSYAHHIENCDIGGAMENLMWGGSDAPGADDWRHSAVPQDVVCRRNRFYKPLWGKRFNDANGEVIYNGGTISIAANGTDVTLSGGDFLGTGALFPINTAPYTPQYLHVESQSGSASYVPIDTTVTVTSTTLKLATAYPSAPFTNVTYRITHYDGVPRYNYNGNKNLLESKYLQRWDMRGNVFEWFWGGGQSFALTLKSQAQTVGGAVFAEASDYTVRYNRFRDVLSSIGTWWTSNGAQRAKRWAVYHNLIDNFGGSRWNGTYSANQIDFVDYMNDLLIEHNTSANDMPGWYGMVVRDDDVIVGGLRLAVRNNIWDYGTFYGGTGGGIFNPETGLYGTAALGWTAGEILWTKNVHYRGNATGAGQSALFPAGNAFVSSEGTIDFVDYAGRNYRLNPSSPYKNWGSDGKDPGVDMDLLEAETAGV